MKQVYGTKRSVCQGQGSLAGGQAYNTRVDVNEVDTEARDNQGEMSCRPEWVSAPLFALTRIL